MSSLEYFTLDDIGYAPDVDTLVFLLSEPGPPPTPLLFVREEQWRDEPFYYLLDEEEVARLLSMVGVAGLGSLDPDELFGLLNIHESTGVATVSADTVPSEPAVVLDADAAPTAVWALARRELVAANGGEEDDRRSWSDDADWVDAPASGPPPTAAGDVENSVGSEPEPERTVRFERNPHMDLSKKEPLAAGDDFEVSVYLDREPAHEGETSFAIGLELPEDVTSLEFEVALVATPHFTIRGGSLRTFEMGRDDLSSPKAEFEVTVVDGPSPSERPRLTAYFSYRQRPCGQVSRSPELGGVSVEPGDGDERDESDMEDVFALDGFAESADVTVQILPTDPDGLHYEVIVRTTLIDGFTPEPEPWGFSEATHEIVGEHMKEFTRKGAAVFDRRIALEGAGVQLWERAPETFKALYWRIVTEELPLKTIFIVSAEPSIPWELMLPERERDDGSTESRSPLGVEFAVGRWVTKKQLSPTQNAPISNSYVVAPEYTPPLDESKEEAAFVCSKFAGELVDPADLAGLSAKLTARPTALLHVIAHGKTASRAAQTITLAGRAAVLTATQVRRVPGLREAFHRTPPFVFLNACEVGRPEPTLFGTAGGFAEEFIRAGARCVVAPLWSVRTGLAHKVAMQFYEAALNDPTKPFAEIMSEIRRRSYADVSAGDPDAGEDTFAAYCFFGDPRSCLAKPIP